MVGSLWARNIPGPPTEGPPTKLLSSRRAMAGAASDGRRQARRRTQALRRNRRTRAEPVRRGRRPAPTRQPSFDTRAQRSPGNACDTPRPGGYESYSRSARHTAKPIMAGASGSLASPLPPCSDKELRRDGGALLKGRTVLMNADWWGIAWATEQGVLDETYLGFIKDYDVTYYRKSLNLQTHENKQDTTRWTLASGSSSLRHFCP